MLFSTSQNSCRQLSLEMVALLERVINDIYHLSTQDIQEIVQQDFGYIPDISAPKLLSRMEQSQNILVINVLSEKWYHDCHIAGSINVPLDKLIYQMEGYDRTQEVIVYCALNECDASEKAYVLLKCMGFENVVDYRGGIKEWFQLGYPIEGACVSSYLHDKIGNRFDAEETCTFDFDFCTVLKKSCLYKSN
jgi:rhodanese-related sulfurtransferase